MKGLMRFTRSMIDLPELATTATGQDLALSSGAMEPVARRAYNQAALGMQGPVSKGVARLTDWSPGLKLTRWTNGLTRTMSAYAGVLDTNNLLKTAQEAYSTGGAESWDKGVADTLINRGVHNADELIINGGKLSPGQVDQIAYDAANKVARTDPWKKAAWMSTPFGSLISQFSNFGFAEAVLGRQVVEKAVKTGDFSPLLRYMAGGTILSAGLVA